MGGGVGRVHELTSQPTAGDLLSKSFCLGDGPLHALASFRQHHLGAVGLHDLAALDTHGFRHDDDGTVASGGGNGGKTDAGIAGGGLNDYTAGMQQPLGLGILDHGLGHTILHGAAGIEVFQLCQNGGFQSFGLFQMGQFQQRGFPNQLVGGCVDVTHIAFLLFHEIVWLGGL